MQTLENTPATLEDKLAPGDELRIVDADGWSTEVIFVAVDGEKLTAHLKNTPDVIIRTPISSLQTIEVRHTNARANISWIWGFILFLMAGAAASP